jgi:hypothetical protein
VAEGSQQQPAGFIVADDANRQHVHAKVSEIIDGVGAAAGNHLSIAMLQNQYRGFARDARNRAEHKLIGNQIRKYGYGELGK